MIKQKKGEFMKKGVKLTVAGVVGAVVLLGGFLSTNVIDEGEKGVVLTFGEISKTWDPGLHFKLPFVQSLKTYSTRVQKTKFGRDINDERSGSSLLGNYASNAPVLSAYSSDQQIIESYSLSVTWSYDPMQIEKVYKYFGTASSDAVFTTVVSPTVIQTTKAILGQYTAQTIVQERTKLDAQIEDALKTELKDFPINILSVQFEDVNFSRRYEDMLEQTAQKKMEIEKANNELQRIQIESRQQVAQAEAQNQAIKLQADAKAYQIRVEAEAEADAIKMRAEALKSNPELVDLTIAEKWDGSVPQTVVAGEGKSVVPLMNIK